MSTFSIAPEEQFCLSNNLEHYFAFSKNKIESWQIFLSMNIPGFHYNKLNLSSEELLNGMSGGTEELLNNFLTQFNLNKVEYDKRDIDRLPDLSPLLVMVDDYELNYNPLFRKYHNTRFICIRREADGCYLIYDNGLKADVQLKDIEQAFISSFQIESSSQLPPTGTVYKMLFDFIQSPQFGPNSESCEEMQRLLNDLKDLNSRIPAEEFYNLFFHINRPSGTSNTRLQMAEALTYLMEKAKLNSLSDRVELYLKLADQWKIFGNLAFRLSRAWSDKHFTRTVERLEVIIEEERQLL